MDGIRRIAAVVLNYKAWRETVACVESLLAQNYSDFAIVIVDNGSDNGSYEQLFERFGSEPRVRLIASKSNLGFARGNNLGIICAHETLGYDTVFVVNSDTIIPPDLFSSIADIDTDGVGVITPTVNCADGTRQVFNINCDDCEKNARRIVNNLIRANVASLPIIRELRKKRRVSSSQKTDVAAPKRYSIYGCAFFLAPAFFEHYRQLYPRTFLYWEEVNLLLYVQRAGLSAKYVETSPIVHLGGASTKAENIDVLPRFRLKNSNRSMFSSLPLLLCKSPDSIKKRFSE